MPFKSRHLCLSVAMAALTALTACAALYPAGATTQPARQAPTPVPPPEKPAPAACMQAPAQFAVGKTADASLVEMARQKSGARLARILRPGQVVTLEFSSERLNLAVDAKGTVTRVTCG